MSAISGPSSKANSLSTILGMPSGPGAFLTFGMPQGDVGFAYSDKKIEGDSLDVNMNVRHVRGREWGESSSETGKEIVNTFTRLRNRRNIGVVN